MSGGPSRAIKGDLAFFASGETDALQKAASVLETMSTAAGNKVNLHYIRKRSFIAETELIRLQLVGWALAPR